MMAKKKGKKKKARPLPVRGDEFDRAVRLLMDACDDRVILMQDVERGLYLVPAVMDEDSTEYLKPGTIEYQLSDGPPGARGSSEDFTDLREAVARFRERSAAARCDRHLIDPDECAIVPGAIPIVSVCCRHCGCTGQVALESTDVDWYSEAP